MNQPFVLYEVKNGIATITMNRPDVHNAFNEIVIGDLIHAFEKAKSDEAVRIVILRGNGKSFSAGGDLNWMRRVADYSREQNITDAARLSDLLVLINTLPKPTIALVQGSAFGGGVGLTAVCDIAIAEEGAKFCLSEVRIGLIPSIILPYVIAAMGERQARRYALSAERFDAALALQMGLVHEVVPEGGLDAMAKKIITSLWDGAPAAQARAKNLILHIAKRVIDAGVVQHTIEQIAEARASAEGKEGLTAFLNKSDPSWKKRN
jgi:methylglutaconyl-CoA hydratase